MFYIVPVVLGWLCFGLIYISYLKNKKLPAVWASLIAVAFVASFVVWGMYLR